MIKENTKLMEQMQFLSQPKEKLISTKGKELYETLNTLGLSYSQYFRALGTNIEEYCAREFGIDLHQITVERFFQTDPNTKWLFPDLVRESVVAGMQSKPIYPQLIIRDEHIGSAVYDVPYVEESEEEEELRLVSEGSAIPESEITYGDRVIRLEKLGRGVIASYEVIRRMSVDMLRVHLRRMGECLGRNLDKRLALILVYGDASGSGTAPEILNSSTAGTWSYTDLVRAFLHLTTKNFFTPTHLVADANTMEALLSLPELTDSGLFDFARSGNLPTPLGVKLVPMADHPANCFTLLDSRYAVQKLTEQDLLVESDRLINQQWDRSYLTVVTDFAVIYQKARVVVRNDWS
ncbi:MAG TPA: hypothetical protein PLT82_11200 [Candidatus Hydrogenedens sp.]|nr:hypothetical protein [Candidatus Hydrogenedens sp.]HOL19681.1 hypothetical protein [Candidatus Hydrogenedens sp.]HPP59689.1 hypothetical protein [Candidatus Hydrogenedens sp.]